MIHNLDLLFLFYQEILRSILEDKNKTTTVEKRKSHNDGELKKEILRQVRITSIVHKQRQQNQTKKEINYREYLSLNNKLY